MQELGRLREATTTFGDTLEVTSRLMNATWPFYNFPDLDVLAQQEVDAKNLENLQYLTRVRHDQRPAYLEFQAGIYERWVKAGHIRYYGSLDVLDQSGYMNDILEFTSSGIVPSSNKEEYYPLAFRYPPPNSYFVINFDISSINYSDLFASLLYLKNQTLLSNLNPYIEGDQAEKEHHAAFHDQVPGSDVSFPHSFLFHPVHERVEDPQSDIVAVVLSPVAWDAALRRLLPNEVEGILAVARNNCGQQITYEIVGEDAFFVGWEDLHDSKYNEYEYIVSLSFGDHPEYYTTPGHCAYSLVSYFDMPETSCESNYQALTLMRGPWLVDWLYWLEYLPKRAIRRGVSFAHSNCFCCPRWVYVFRYDFRLLHL